MSKKTKGVRLKDGRVVTKENSHSFMISEAKEKIRAMGLDPNDFNIEISGVEAKKAEGCVQVKCKITPKLTIIGPN